MTDAAQPLFAEWVLWGPVLIAAAGFFTFRGLALLLFYQQEEYDSPRFLKWLAANKLFDRQASLFVLAAFLLILLAPTGSLVAGAAMAAIMSFLGLMLGLLRSRKLLNAAKKPLVMTSRAKKILAIYLALTFALTAGALVVLQPGPASALIILLIGLQLPPLLLTLANLLLQPLEKRVQAKYLAEARDKLDNLSPIIIGITGSYGKTSTKHILAHILSAAAPTLATPGSVNTEMGITRIIREQLEPAHKYFVVEMGAYGRGSIARLCRLAPPSLGLITAIGKAHFERFGSLEEVAAAKFELADHVAAKGGVTFVNSDQMPGSELLSQADQLLPHLVFCGSSGGEIANSATLESVHQDENGLQLKIRFGNEEADIIENFAVPVFGKQQSGNILLAMAAAIKLGVPREIVKASLTSLGQTRHRLEVIKPDHGPTVIDDAYNSNPEGFESALETLDMLALGNGRRILLTPGMVELGSEHDSEHARLGRLSAQYVDIALIVTPSRIPSFTEAFSRAKSADQTMIEFDTQAMAETWLKANIRGQDVVLFENNLPDLFEARLRF